MTSIVERRQRANLPTKADKAVEPFSFEWFSDRLFYRLDQIAPEFLFIEMGKEWLGWYLEPGVPPASSTQSLPLWGAD